MATKAKKTAPAIATSEKVSEVVDMIREHMPHVKIAYINEKGEYHFHPRKGFAPVSIDGGEIVDEPVKAKEESPAATATPELGKDLEF
jgi:hypothetical protein